MTFSPTSRQIVLQEVFDEASVPTDEEIHDYALKIGINVENEPHLLYIARDGLMEALPAGWNPCFDEDKKEIYYFNFKTAKAQWEHPLDEVYRNLVKKARKEGVIPTDQIDDDSRTSIKEDLKSFEEASLILPSSEMYSKPKALEPLSPLGVGSFRRSSSAFTPMKKSSSKELLKSGLLKLPLDMDEDLILTKAFECESNLLRKINFDETEVRKRPNSSDIRNRRNIGPMEFRHLSKQEVITPKQYGKGLFLVENKRPGEILKLNDLQNIENKTNEIVTATKDEGYGTEFSVSSLADKEVEVGIGKRELTLRGGGSAFLKTNKNKFSPSSDITMSTFSKEELSDGLASSMYGRKSCSEIEPHSKNILAAHKLTKSGDKDETYFKIGLRNTIRKDSEEDRKSVRFNLEKDLKVNFELPDSSRTESQENASGDSKISKSTLQSAKSPKIETKENTKQIEIDFEELEIDLGDKNIEDEQKNFKLFVEHKLPVRTELKTVKPKTFKSSQTLVQEYREIFEVKSKNKINIPISSPLKIEEKVTEQPDETKQYSSRVSDEVDLSENEKTKPTPENKINISTDILKINSQDFVGLNSFKETKDSKSSNENQKEYGKSLDLGLSLKDEIFDSDFSGTVDFAVKKKLFEGAVDSVKTAGSKSRNTYKEKNLILNDLLKTDENGISVDNTDDKLNADELSLNMKSESDTLEKKNEEVSGRYERRKNEKLKSLEANFNEWLSETEKIFEDKKSNALIKMKEKFEDWKVSREIEFEKIYSEKREEETQNKFKELRNEFLKKEQEDMEKLKDQLEKEKREKLSYMKNLFENEIEKERKVMRKLLEERLNDDEMNLMQEHKEALEKMEKNLQEIISEKKSQKMKQLEMTKESEIEIEALKLELKDNYQKQKMNLMKEHELLLDNLRQKHAVAIENLRIEFRNEEEAVRKLHTDRLDEMRMKLTAIEAKKLDNTDNQKAEVNDTRIYEKLRCEKRLLEDKYKMLKEKYVKLKSETRSIMDKKHKKDMATTGSETEKSSSNKSNSVLRKSNCDSFNSIRSHEIGKRAKIKKSFANLDNLNPNVSTDEEENVSLKNMSSPMSISYPNEVRKMKKAPPEALKKNKKNEEKHVIRCDNNEEESRSSFYSKSLEGMEKNHSNETKKKRQIFSRLKTANFSKVNIQSDTQEEEGSHLSPVENLRRQLKKLEELEDQFPVTTHTDTYMRYPFTDIPQVGSSEIEFFKHRIHLERESVRRAKESLKMQKKSFENRQRELKQKLLDGSPEAKTVMEQVYQEEKELTDMEVSVHRTRALLGEKIIRLRHLEQSLKRISEPRKKESFMSKDLLGRLGFRNQSREEDRTLSDLSSHSGSSGFSSTDFNLTDTHNQIGRGYYRIIADENHPQFHNTMKESSEIIQSLDNLNSEIKEIWEVLKKQHSSNQNGALLLPPPPLIYGDAAWPTLTVTPPVAFRNTIITSSNSAERSVAQQLKNQVTRTAGFDTAVTTVIDSTLVDRTKSLRDWLKAARSSSTTSEVISPNQVTL